MLPRPIIKESHQEELDSDLKLLLTSVEPLLQSRNPAVRASTTIPTPSPLTRIIGRSWRHQSILLRGTSILPVTGSRPSPPPSHHIKRS